MVYLSCEGDAMGKKLSEMSLEELWQLFPIVLTAHNDEWKNWYTEEKKALEMALPYAVFHHIGSTAIENIMAKPIIDILAEVKTLSDESEKDKIKAALTAAGYLCMHEENSRLDFNKGYTENGFAERVFHLHVRVMGDNDEIVFRDYLNIHKDIAAEYETLKLRLWREFEHDRDGYTAAKGDFVRRYTAEAKQFFARKK